MDQALRQLVEDAVSSRLVPVQQFDRFRESRGLGLSVFLEVFAKHVAIEFAHGEIGYGEADVAMEAMASYASGEFPPIALELYLAFDAGQYRPPSEPPSIIPWQRHTLPLVMEILSRESLLPRT